MEKKKSLALTVVWPQTVQPVASHYTNYAIQTPFASKAWVETFTSKTKKI
jgi:hypothetical protein